MIDMNLRFLSIVAVTFLALHALCLLLAPTSVWVSYPFLILAPWSAMAACIYRARTSSDRTRLAWGMISAGIFLWVCGMALAAWGDLAVNAPLSVAYVSDFIYFVYGVPILLVMSWPAESERISLLLWLDGLQTVMATCLIYVVLFSVFPFVHAPTEPIAVALLAKTFTIENLILASCGLLRLLTRSGSSEERRLYQIITAFLWLYAVCAYWYNYEAVRLNGNVGFFELLSDLPFLALGVAVLSVPAPVNKSSDERSSQSLFAHLIDSGCPAVFTLALLALGMALVRRHFLVGIGAITFAMLIYVVRMTALQVFYKASQKDLRAARDELENLSLTDGLTGVANRRCFDQVLPREWRRALRLNESLTLVMIDIDHFKLLNDHYGHQTGDQCLKRVAQALRAALPRAGDLLARYGGEEFVALVAATEREGGEAVATRMQSYVRALKLENVTAATKQVTISLGVISLTPDERMLPDQMVRAADHALYAAKQNGRDRIEAGHL
jgi:diguanylate cyclase (GGDEF)-like protein